MSLLMFWNILPSFLLPLLTTAQEGLARDLLQRCSKAGLPERVMINTWHVYIFSCREALTGTVRKMIQHLETLAGEITPTMWSIYFCKNQEKTMALPFKVVLRKLHPSSCLISPENG